MCGRLLAPDLLTGRLRRPAFAGVKGTPVLEGCTITVPLASRSPESAGRAGSPPFPAREGEGTMTERRHFKQLVRARMAKTGESYSTARRHILAQAPEFAAAIPPLHHSPGNTPGPTALRALLSHAGVRAPHTGAPFSEAMVFGVAGGIGAGMFPFHYAKENFSSFFVAGRHLWHDHAAWALAAAKRMGLKAVVKESSGVKPGEKQLRELVDGGRPVLVWLTFRGRMYHVATVHAIDM